MAYSAPGESAPEVQPDPIKTVLQEWRMGMKPHVRSLLSRYLSRRSRPEILSIGSMFSGTDIVDTTGHLGRARDGERLVLATQGHGMERRHTSH